MAESKKTIISRLKVPISSHARTLSHTTGPSKCRSVEDIPNSQSQAGAKPLRENALSKLPYKSKLPSKQPTTSKESTIGRKLLRRSNSVPVLLNINKKFPSQKNITTRPGQSKRPALTELEAAAPNTVKPPKLKRYDFKGRYNRQVENNTVLKTKLNEFEQQLSEMSNIKKLYDDVTQNYKALKVVFEDKTQECELLLQKFTKEKKGHDETRSALSKVLTENRKMEEMINSIEEKCANLQTKNSNLETTIENLTQEKDKMIEREVNYLEIIREQEVTLSNLKKDVHNLEDLRRTMHNQIQDLKGTIRVFCRVRPDLPSESSKCLCGINYIDENTLEIKKGKEIMNAGNGKLEFVFDKVFSPSSRQCEVFEELSLLIQSVIDGYNVCVFAYGQTGSGKTYTMQGGLTETDLGMIPRSIDLIFKLIEKYEQIGWTYKIEASFLEIYNETIHDLLDLNAKDNLEIKYNDGKGMTVKNLTTTGVRTANELHNLMRQAAQNRIVAVTNYNEHSSRSHAVSKITITANNFETCTAYTSSLNLVDLAGSESAKTSQRMDETKNINKSLSALGTVMMALQNKESHVPYRNSKLTYLLQSSLGGNSKTLMFVNIAPLDEWYSESVHALRFASNVKQIKITSKKNKTYIKSQEV